MILRSMIYATPVFGVLWMIRGMKKKAKDHNDFDDASFPIKRDHSKDNIEDHVVTKLEEQAGKENVSRFIRNEKK